MPYRPIEVMNNTAWQNGRKAAGLGDLHVHDLRHTVGMRLREAGMLESTAADVLWHSVKTMTQHCSMAQIAELHAALEKVKADSGRWNKTLATLRQEQKERALGKPTSPKSPQEKVA
jgi:integrase